MKYLVIFFFGLICGTLVPDFTVFDSALQLVALFGRGCQLDPKILELPLQFVASLKCFLEGIR